MVILLNGSLRGRRGNGYYLLQRLQECGLGECAERGIVEVLRDPDRFAGELSLADALVIAAPLYVDGLPAQMLRLMEELYEKRGAVKEGLRVYVLSNLGFYESVQIKTLLDIVKNWCKRMDFVYGGGLAVGAGGMMSAFRSIPLGAGPNKALGRDLKKLAVAIRTGGEMGNIFSQPSFLPRFIYMQAAHTLFRRTGKANGAKVE